MAPRISLGKRSVALLLAVALAAVATVALVSYVQGLEDRAFEGVETVQVFVAKDTISLGMPAETAIGRGLITRETIPRKFRATGVILSLEQIKGKVAAIRIAKGEQILAERFVAAAQVARGLPIPEDRQAMSFDVDIPRGVAGFIQPGQRISIIASLADTSRNDASERVQFLLQNVEVLAVGSRTVTSRTDEQQATGRRATRQPNRVLLTVSLTPRDAEKLAFALFHGEIRLTLLPPGAKSSRTPGRTSDNVFR